MTSLGFTNPSAQAVVVDISMFSKDRITKITSYVGGIPTYTKLEGLKFSPSGIVRQFPDLKGKPLGEMRVIALKRFKEHLSKINTEKELIKYVKQELEKTGYVLNQIIRPGHRPVNIKHGKHNR